MKLLVALAAALIAGSQPAVEVQLGTPSFGLAAAGGSVWVGGLDSGTVLRVDPAGKVTARLHVGSRIFNLAAAPGAVWAVDNTDGTAIRIDARTGKVTARLRPGPAPYDVEWGFGSAWVSNAGAGTVSRITGTKVVKTIKIGTEPNGLTAYRGALWVSDHTEGKVVRIDPRTMTVTATIPMPGADWITGIGDAIYVSQETNTISRIALGSLKVTGRVHVAHNPLGTALVGKELWVPCIDDSQVDVIDPATMRVVARKQLGSGPIVVLPAFGHTWISNTLGQALVRVD
jgi:DNA-binding beta-propeller fold protein YncE